MMTKKIIFIWIITYTIIGTSCGQSKIVPSYKVSRTTIPILIDGKLDDPSWAKAALINNFVINSDNSPTPYNTEGKILYDDKFIYFAFRCIDDNIWATKNKRDDHLWEEEVVEVFIQPNPTESSYIEIEVNPLGSLLDAYMLDSVKCLPYDSWNMVDIKWAVHVQGTVDGKPGDTAWTCEIAFPIVNAVTAINIPPKAEDIWRINLYRAELKPSYALISWSPTYRDDFHMPSFFGKLIFTDNKTL
jgi:hypothetical protein